jgi:hypothetical protein
VDVELATASKCEEIGKETRDIGYVGKQDILPYTALIDLDYHLPHGNYLVRGGACEDHVN